MLTNSLEVELDVYNPSPAGVKTGGASKISVVYTVSSRPVRELGGGGCGQCLRNSRSARLLPPWACTDSEKGVQEWRPWKASNSDVFPRYRKNPLCTVMSVRLKSEKNS